MKALVFRDVILSGNSFKKQSPYFDPLIGRKYGSLQSWLLCFRYITDERIDLMGKMRTERKVHGPNYVGTKQDLAAKKL